MPARFDLVLDGEPRSFTGYLAAAANSGRFGGGMRLAPDAQLDDGLFDIVILEDVPRLTFIRNMTRVFNGTHTQLDKVHVLRAREVHLNADRPFEVYADGDQIATTPMTLRVAPGALQVRAP